MSFNSVEFLLFFFVLVISFYLIPSKLRWLLLLLASYVFYMSWKVEYGLLILATTAVSFVSGIKIEKEKKDSIQKLWLAFALLANFGILFYFKYYNFFLDSISSFSSVLGMQIDMRYIRLLLPVGISFYTFQSAGYVLDVYLGVTKAERHFGRFALFVSFFSQLLSGPIERANDMLPQLRFQKKLDYSDLSEGLKLMVWGLFKKIVIADRLSMFTAVVFDKPQVHSGPELMMATYFFAFQLYCDFSGYTDIAIGSARMLGIKLTPNFKRPLFSRSLTEFFTRWHITLFSWLNDYVYLPMAVQLRRLRVVGVAIAVFLTFMISGVWHGAGWNFILWGVLLGGGMAYEKLTLKTRRKAFAWMPTWLNNFFSIMVTVHFMILINIFIGVGSVPDAWYIVSHLFDFSTASMFRTGSGLASLVYSFGGILFLIFIEIQQEYYGRTSNFSESKYAFFRYASYVLIILLILLFGVFDGGQFIYFGF